MRVSPDALVTGLVTGLVGLLSAWATWRVGRRQARANLVQARADVIRAAQEAAHQVIQDLRAEVDRIKADRLEVLGKHAECQREVGALRSELAEVRQQIDALMAGPPASY